ncbi:MAG: hypothetical protein ABIQ54_04375 [Gammaproteobacteria bacterium]
MSKQTLPLIPGTEEAWDTGALGEDENFVAVAPDADHEINEHLELQPISIRLEKSLIEDFKMIAALSGLSYQPLMRQCLRRFADGEIKRILRGFIAEKAAALELAEQKKAQKKSKAA